MGKKRSLWKGKMLMWRKCKKSIFFYVKQKQLGGPSASHHKWIVRQLLLQQWPHKSNCNPHQSGRAPSSWSTFPKSALNETNDALWRRGQLALYVLDIWCWNVSCIGYGSCHMVWIIQHCLTTDFPSVQLPQHKWNESKGNNFLA